MRTVGGRKSEEAVKKPVKRETAKRETVKKAEKAAKDEVKK